MQVGEFDELLGPLAMEGTGHCPVRTICQTRKEKGTQGGQSAPPKAQVV